LFNFFFKKKESAFLDFSRIGVDMHSHLIPGIDDGAKTIEDSLVLIKGLQDLGFSKIITTPHIYKEHYPNTKEIIGEGLYKVNEALKGANNPIEIEASAEYFMDDHFEGLITENDIRPLQGKYVLVEMSFFGAPPKLEEYIFKIQLKGYTPILAHPERYLFFHKEYERFSELKETGILFQINASSIAGYYGKPVRQITEKLLKDKLVDLIGTDMHHKGHLEYLKTNIKNKEFQQILSKYEFQNAEIFG
jgi:protein-tyrosine phosphatase